MTRFRGINQNSPTQPSPNLRGIRGIGRLCQDEWWMIYIQRGVVLKKHGLEMGWETHLNIKYFNIKGAVGYWQGSVDLLSLYLVSKEPGECHTTYLDRQ